MATTYPSVRAVYRAGVLQLLEPLALSDGAEVRVYVESSSRPRAYLDQEPASIQTIRSRLPPSVLWKA